MGTSVSPINGDTYPKYRLHFAQMDDTHTSVVTVFDLNIEVDTAGGGPLDDSQVSALEGHLKVMFDALKAQSNLYVTAYEPNLRRYEETMTVIDGAP
jgi:hypothetical protein